MLKKLIIAAISASFVISTAFADSTNVGVRLSSSTLSATGTQTVDKAGSNSGGAAATHAEKEATFVLPSIFAEREFDLNTGSIAIGLDYVPLTAEVDKLGGGDGTDATVKAGNLMTLYVQPSYAINDNIKLFGKIGYAHGDLEISDITRQATVASQTNDAASTDTTASKSLEGPVYGLGAQYNKGEGTFLRLEATRTDFDEISHTNSNGKILKADSEMDLITFTIGKSF